MRSARAADAARRVRAAATCLLLGLTADASPLVRLDALLPLVHCQRAGAVPCPEASPSEPHEPPLPLRSQIQLFGSLFAAAATASAAMADLCVTWGLAEALETPASVALDAAAVEAALQAALPKRPQTWAVRPPPAREFLLWCATADATISAAVARTELTNVEETAPGYLVPLARHDEGYPSTLEGGAPATTAGVREGEEDDAAPAVEATVVVEPVPQDGASGAEVPGSASGSAASDDALAGMFAQGLLSDSDYTRPLVDGTPAEA